MHSPEQNPITTSNGMHEIEHPRETIGYDEFRGMLDAYHLGGDTPTERIEALKAHTNESLAIFMTDLNARLNGSEASLVHEETMKIGDKQTVAAEHRYDLFNNIVDKIKSAPKDVNPERLGDALALTTVLLHPFKDGNGRTARMFGYMFREGLDSQDAQEDFATLVEPRDQARERGGFMINGYVPYMGEGVDQSDPQQINQYIDKLLTNNDQLYTSPWGQAELKAEADAIRSEYRSEQVQRWADELNSPHITPEEVAEIEVEMKAAVKAEANNVTDPDSPRKWFGDRIKRNDKKSREGLSYSGREHGTTNSHQYVAELMNDFLTGNFEAYNLLDDIEVRGSVVENGQHRAAALAMLYGDRWREQAQAKYAQRVEDIESSSL